MTTEEEAAEGVGVEEEEEDSLCFVMNKYRRTEPMICIRSAAVSTVDWPVEQKKVKHRIRTKLREKRKQ